MKCYNGVSVQLYVLMEYCRHGCLRDYLVSQRQRFRDTMDDVDQPAVAVWFKRPKLVTFQSESSHLDLNSCDEHVVLTTKDLVCYAFQIARGMDFLASRKVYVVSTAKPTFTPGTSCFIFLIICSCKRHRPTLMAHAVHGVLKNY